MNSLRVASGMALLICSLAAYAQTEANCGQTLEAPLHSHAVLTIDSRPAGLEVIGTNEEEIRVTCTGKDVVSVGQVRIKLSGSQDYRKLTINGSTFGDNNLKIRIEVPRKTSLRVRMAAGQVTLNEIVGDKDIDLYAGQISISSARPWDYRHIDLSASIGEVKASAYGSDRGGFFRSFHRSMANGEYGLHAHVMTGQIELLSARAAHPLSSSQ